MQLVQKGTSLVYVAASCGTCSCTMPGCSVQASSGSFTPSGSVHSSFIRRTFSMYCFRSFSFRSFSSLGQGIPTRVGAGYPAVVSHVLAVLVVRGRSGDSRRALEGAVCGSAAGGSHGTSGWCSNLLCVGRGRFRARDGERVPRTPSCVDAAFAGQRHHRAAPSSRLDEDTGEHRHARGDR